MKKLGLLILSFLFCGMAFATPVEFTRTLTTITGNITVTSDTLRTANLKDITIYVNYDETETGTISAALSYDVSVDGTNWIDGSFFDFSGGPASFQTSETLSSDTNYIFWLEKATNYPFIRIQAVGSVTDVADEADIVIKIRGVR